MIVPLRGGREAEPDDLLDRLAEATSRLARRNEALEDFAALVAHELKAPLQAALVSDDPSPSIEQALELVDSLLEAARSEPTRSGYASASDVFDGVVRELGADDVSITGEFDGSFPLPPEALRVILRNLLRNAVAAGSRAVHVSAVQSAGDRSWSLVVDDDGVGLTEVARYGTGTGIGLRLCRRIAGRFGGTLELAPRRPGGTRATLVLAEAA